MSISDPSPQSRTPSRHSRSYTRRRHTVHGGDVEMSNTIFSIRVRHLEHPLSFHASVFGGSTRTPDTSMEKSHVTEGEDEMQCNNAYETDATNMLSASTPCTMLKNNHRCNANATTLDANTSYSFDLFARKTGWYQRGRWLASAMGPSTAGADADG